MVSLVIPLRRVWQGQELGQTVECNAPGFAGVGVRLWAERAGDPSARAADATWHNPDARRGAVVAGAS
jgi:hypothetical protein